MELTLLFWAFLALAVVPLIPVLLHCLRGRRVDDHVSGADQVDEYELYLRTGVSPESAEGTGEGKIGARQPEQASERQSRDMPLIYRKRSG